MIHCIGIVLLIVGWFYWFQWRPSAIRKVCMQATYNTLRDKYDIGYQSGIYNNYYEYCLKRKGIAK